MFCTNCGSEIGETARFCHSCGTPVPEQTTATAVKPGEAQRDTAHGGARLETIGDRATAGAAVGNPAAVSALTPGTVLGGRYEIRRVLGQGGMGAVYEAFDQMLQDAVALKVMLPVLAENEHARQRFVREARISRQLTHKNIVRTHDMTVVDGCPCISMEFVQGNNLRQFMDSRWRKNRPPTIQEVVSVAKHLCAAMEYAHEMTVHRDLKPENILIARSGTIKVSDFGIAALLDLSESKLTRGMVGTAYYMAPEQMRPGATVDQRADVYSLGVILYEMLVGTVPAGRFHSPCELRDDVPQHISDVVSRSLEPKPDDRLRTMAEFRRALAKADAISIRKSPVASTESADADHVHRLAITAGVLGYAFVALGESFPREKRDHYRTVCAKLQVSDALLTESARASSDSAGVKLSPPQQLSELDAYLLQPLRKRWGERALAGAEFGASAQYLVTSLAFEGQNEQFRQLKSQSAMVLFADTIAKAMKADLPDNETQVLRKLRDEYERVQTDPSAVNELSGKVSAFIGRVAVDYLTSADGLQTAASGKRTTRRSPDPKHTAAPQPEAANVEDAETYRLADSDRPSAQIPKQQQDAANRKKNRLRRMDAQGHSRRTPANKSASVRAANRPLQLAFTAGYYAWGLYAGPTLQGYDNSADEQGFNRIAPQLGIKKAGSRLFRRKLTALDVNQHLMAKVLNPIGSKHGNCSQVHALVGSALHGVEVTLSLEFRAKTQSIDNATKDALPRLTKSNEQGLNNLTANATVAGMPLDHLDFLQKAQSAYLQGKEPANIIVVMAHLQSFKKLYFLEAGQ